MFCLYCDRQAEFICQCFGRICKNHFTVHTESCKTSIVKKIEDSDRLKLLSMTLAQRINRINEICQEITFNTQELLNKIENLCKKSILKLKKLKFKYSKILEKGMLKNLEAELTKKIEFKEVKFPNLKIIEEYYNESFIVEKKEYLFAKQNLFASSEELNKPLIKPKVSGMLEKPNLYSSAAKIDKSLIKPEFNDSPIFGNLNFYSSKRVGRSSAIPEANSLFRN